MFISTLLEAFDVKMFGELFQKVKYLNVAIFENGGTNIKSV